MVRWRDDPKAYNTEYHKNLTAEQRAAKAIRMQQWWSSDRGKYSSHKARAKRSKIEFLLSFDDWLRIWKDSGHYEDRGPTGYVMCRINDEGAYTEDNIYIAHASENKRDAWFNNKVCLPNTGLFYKDTV